jgi:hypothetical protein
VTSLVEWLRSALDEHERIALAAEDLQPAIIGAVKIGVRSKFMAFAHANGPAHVLRTVQAHREILDRHAGTWHFDVIWMCRKCGNVAAPCADVLSLLRIYRDHPGFDPSWLGEES